MKNYLGIDLGRKHTGLAFADSRVNVALPLTTIHHKDEPELLEALEKIIRDREVGIIVVGLPILMSGEEGEEALHVRTVTELIQEAHPECAISFLDERETSKIYSAEGSRDRHAEAAVRILATFLEREESK
ncbi:MAG TPA: Holliday junction resolvase RuvX [Candidatus Peribacterales bacterium]|nr:Holliday junction resolvase RuvX [Candidatus Peribacterales bacterium]